MGYTTYYYRKNLVHAQTNPDGSTSLVGAGGVGFPFVVAALSESNTGAQNVAALQAAHDALATTGGIALLPTGEFNLAGTVTITGGNNTSSSPFSTDYGNTNIIFRGQGIGATVLVQQTAGVPTFQKASGYAHGFEDLSLIGPGTGNADSVGIQWDNAAGGSLWKNVWVSNFGYGCRFVDATLMTFVNVHWYGNGVNIGLGFQCDGFNFVGCRNRNPVTKGMEIGYRDASHTSGGLQINALNVTGMIFVSTASTGSTAVAIDIPDYAASNLMFDSCYFENWDRILTAGDVAQAGGPKGIVFQTCFFTIVGGNKGSTSTQTQFNIDIESTHVQNSSLSLVSCRSDTAAGSGASGFNGRWVDYGRDSKVLIDDCTLPTAAASACRWKSSVPVSLDSSARQVTRLGRSYAVVADGSVLSTSYPPIDVSMTNGGSANYARFKRLDSSTGAIIGDADTKIRDINSKYVTVDAPLRPATPSAALPTASSTYRGVTLYQEGGAGVADTIVCCMKDSADAYSWKVVATG